MKENLIAFGCVPRWRDLISHLQLPGALDLLRERGGPLEQTGQGVREMKGGLELVVGQHPQQVVQDEHQPAPQHAAVRHALLDGQPDRIMFHFITSWCCTFSAE